MTGHKGIKDTSREDVFELLKDAAWKFRLQANTNVPEIDEGSSTRCVFRMKSCRVLEARRRQGFQEFPCQSVGVIEHSECKL